MPKKPQLRLRFPCQITDLALSRERHESQTASPESNARSVCSAVLGRRTRPLIALHAWQPLFHLLCTAVLSSTPPRHSA
jgi:hypothetical protein